MLQPRDITLVVLWSFVSVHILFMCVASQYYGCIRYVHVFCYSVAVYIAI